MEKYPPSVPLARLFERTSRKTGNVYLSGFMGLARITVLKTAEQDSEGRGIWAVLVQQAPRREKSEQPADETSEA